METSFMRLPFIKSLVRSIESARIDDSYLNFLLLYHWRTEIQLEFRNTVQQSHYSLTVHRTS